MRRKLKQRAFCICYYICLYTSPSVLRVFCRGELQPTPGESVEPGGEQVALGGLEAPALVVFTPSAVQNCPLVPVTATATAALITARAEVYSAHLLPLPVSTIQCHNYAKALQEVL